MAADPISAIDWLDQVEGLAALPAQPSQPGRPGGSVLLEPPVAQSIQTPEVTTRPLDAPQAGAVGLLPRSVTGLPATIWQKSVAQTVIRKLDGLQVAGLPALQSLLYSLLLTEADPPMGDTEGMGFLLARIDKLTELGAVDPALAMAERASPTRDADLFSRWFDLALLTGDDHQVCAEMRDTPTLAPSMPALAFCRASQGEWDLAALTFSNAAALGLMPAAEETLLRLYLDPDLAEETPGLPPPARVTPLSFRLAEAIGQPLPSTGLPRAYAMADLRGLSGWRAEIEAAERLTRTGALAENRLLGIYTDRAPAASGGLWDRVAAIRDLDLAIESDDPLAVASILPGTWDHIREVELEVPFARLWGARLAGMDLKGRAADLAFDMAMLSAEYETLARDLPQPDARRRFLASLAAGTPSLEDAPDDTARAIARGFADDAVLPASVRLDIAQGKLGEAILQAMTYAARAAEGGTKDIAPALSTLRALGLEDTARRAAMQLMLLERHL